MCTDIVYHAKQMVFLMDIVAKTRQWSRSMALRSIWLQMHT